MSSRDRLQGVQDAIDTLEKALPYVQKKSEIPGFNLAITALKKGLEVKQDIQKMIDQDICPSCRGQLDMAYGDVLKCRSCKRTYDP